MDVDPGLHRLSHRLSRVLDDVGVSRCMIDRRRRTFLTRENDWTVYHRLMEKQMTVYHFGSQSEGTTTPGMGSDLDTLLDMRNFPVIMDWGEWQYGKGNLLMLKDDTSPPRHCNLQVLKDDSPEPLTDTMKPDHTRDIHGRILVNNTYFDTLYKSVLRSDQKYVKNGPSGSHIPDYDIVHAYHCARLPAECRTWLNRPRPGHWPAAHILQRASECGTFVVPVGHPGSENERVEWRFSTSMIERILMFTLNETQLKTYIVLKMIKKTFFKPVVGDRLSSFHCKCAVLFTVENTPPTIWSDEKLVYCVVRCLITLKRWMGIAFCPHYVIPSMNLFTGKLARYQLKKLTAIVSEMIETNLQCIYRIEMDGVGERMSLCVNRQGQFQTLYQCHLDIAYDLLDTKLCCFSTLVSKFMKSLNERDYIEAYTSLYKHVTSLVIDTNHVDKNMRSAIRTYIPHLVSSLASMQAAMCNKYKLPITQQTLCLYQLSFNTDVASSRLKFASMCYCRGELELAADVLQYVETHYNPYVVPICVCLGRRTVAIGTREYKIRAMNLPEKELVRSSVAYCVRFLRHEGMCVPEHLQYEMYRTIEDDVHYRDKDYDWMDMAVVDSLPYLYYLQYLTFRGLGRPDLQGRALVNLTRYVTDRNIPCCHIDTACNILGNCWELENKLEIAHQCYDTSLGLYPRNNAAKWHMIRLGRLNR